MNKQRSLTALVVAILLLGQPSCSRQRAPSPDGEQPAARAKLQVSVANYPLKYFAERIGGEHVSVHFPVPADEDPAFWMPDAETIAAYQQADLILLNGAGYEKWMNIASLPESKLCNTSSRFADSLIATEETVTHSHGPEGEHTHAGTAFTTWLDPTLAIQQADAVRAALAGLRPDLSASFQRNFAELKTDLEALDAKIATTVEKAPDRPVLFSHPVYQYLERRFGLNARSLHWEPDEPPTDGMWADLKALLAEHPAEWMIWEGTPTAATVDQLAELGVQSVVFDPCGNVPPDGDYLTVQHSNAEHLARVFSD